VRSALATAAAGLGCERRQSTLSHTPRQEDPRRRDASARSDASTPAAETSGTTSTSDWQPFSVIEAAGSPEELGARIGELTADRIRSTIDAQRDWFETLRGFASADRRTRFDPFVAAIERHHPDVMAELRGLAQGARLPVDDLILWNLQPELGTLRRIESSAGCSTLHLVSERRALLAHNEDGSSVYRQEMVILKLRPSGKPAFTCLAYPGLVPGQVPAMNSAGLIMSTNFISAPEVRPGVPRYVLGRAVMGCTTIDEALRVVTNPDRAFAFTLNLGSSHERRLVCLEIAPGVHDIREERGLFAHANHLVLGGTRSVHTEPITPTSSSGSRQSVLDEAVANLPNVARVNETDLIRLLASHQAVAQPFSPCRHPTPDASTQTLATALFDIRAGTFALYEGNPCEGRRRLLELPG
jgi:predicted choloylglycine hydrolase